MSNAMTKSNNIVTKASKSRSTQVKKTQFDQFAQTIAAFRDQKAQAQRDFDSLESLPYLQLKRLKNLAKQVTSSKHSLGLNNIHDPNDKDRVIILTSTLDERVQQLVAKQLIADPSNIKTPQEKFCQLLILSPATYELTQSKGSVAKSTQFYELLEYIIAQRDGSFTHAQLVGWLSGVGGWPKAQAEVVVSEVVVKLIGRDVCEAMPEVSRIHNLPKPENAVGPDIQIFHKTGRLYKAGFILDPGQTKALQPQLKKKPSYVQVAVQSDWIKGFDIVPKYKKAFENEIREMCHMPKS